MKQKHLTHAIFTPVILAFALSACSSGDNDSGGTTQPETGEETEVIPTVPTVPTTPESDDNDDTTTPDTDSNDSTSIDTLTGLTSFNYTFGANYNVQFEYGDRAQSNGIDFRFALAKVTSSAFSGVAVLNPVLCFSWSNLAAVVTPGDADAAAIFEGSYICTFDFEGGAEEWYQLKIASDGSVTGAYEFIAAGSDDEGLVELWSSPDALVYGDHYSNRSNIRSSFDNLPILDSSLFEAFNASVDDDTVRSIVKPSNLAAEVRYLDSAKSLLNSLDK